MAKAARLTWEMHLDAPQLHEPGRVGWGGCISRWCARMRLRPLNMTPPGFRAATPSRWTPSLISGVHRRISEANMNPCLPSPQSTTA